MTRKRKPFSSRTLRPTESSIHSAVIEHWRLNGAPGTLVATIPNMGAMGQAGLTKGLPDLMVIGPNLPIGRVGYIELKSDSGTPSEEQEAFGRLCDTLGIPFAITYGRDEPIRVLEAWGVLPVKGILQ